MPRKKLERSVDFPYHITARANNRENFPGALEDVWKIFSSELLLQHLCHSIRIHAFVLMPNHFHLLMSSPTRSIDLVMKEFLGSSTRILNTRTRRSGRIFGGKYFWSIIKQPDYYAHALRYVYQNPLKARLSESVSEYPFTTYGGLMGSVHLPFPMYEPAGPLGRLVPADPEKRDIWLNSAFGSKEREAIRRGLRKTEFRLSVDRTTRKPIGISI